MKVTLEKVRAISTNDKLIRDFLIKDIKNTYQKSTVRIIEEFGLDDGAARIDVAVVNGVMHGYEIKSDLDTLDRLPKQMDAYNRVFDKVTLVVGSHHFYEAFNLVPDWWGVTLAKIDKDGNVFFSQVREPQENTQQQKISIAQLLWKDEALSILEDVNSVYGFRSKNKSIIHERLSEILDLDALKNRVRKILLTSRNDWRAGTLPVQYGD